MCLFELWFSQGICPVVALPGHIVVLFLFFFKESPWKMKVAQSCPTVCDPKSIVHGILWARILEWVAFPFSRGFSQPMDHPGLPQCGQILYHLSHRGSPRILEWAAYPFSRGSFWPRNWTGISCIAGGFFTSWATGEPKNTGVGSPSLLQWIFPTQALNRGLLHRRWILYLLSHQGSSIFIYGTW